MAEPAAAVDPKSAAASKGKTPVPTPAPVSMPGSQETKVDEVIKNDLDKFQFADIVVADCTITTIAAKKRRTFVDPFVYKEPVEEGLELREIKTPAPVEVIEPTQLLGNKKINDKNGGDAGCLYKTPQVMP